MEVTQLAPNLFVGAQIAEDDLAELADAGFTDVVCNRPDAEHPGGSASSNMTEAATELGLAFHYHPITPGVPLAEEAEKLAQVVEKPGAKVFAYCRSGMRTTNAWSLAQVN
ncbi:MAG: TIGR01244 family sulfur transferase [Pseudomonadota bacterium]|nr:TIGR01244 family sulfur transferase [Pseudomonadota bacterium]